MAERPCPQRIRVDRSKFGNSHMRSGCDRVGICRGLIARSRVTGAKGAKVFMTSQFDCVGAALADGMVSDGDEGYEVASAAVENQRRVVIAFVGMAFEARIAAGP